MNADLMFGLLFGGIFVLIGMVLLFNARRNYQLAKKTSSWPQTTGTILKSDIVSSWSGTGRGSHKVYCPEIHYRYNVDKQEYHSSQIFIGSIGQTKSRSYANKYVSKYPVGKQVMVHYSSNIYQISNKERYSVLETGVNYTIYGSGLISVLLIGGGGAFLITQHSTHGILTAVGGAVLGMWIGGKLSGVDLLNLRKKYHSSRARNRTFGNIPGTDGFAGGKNQLMDIFVKSGDSFLSKRKWRARSK